MAVPNSSLSPSRRLYRVAPLFLRIAIGLWCLLAFAPQTVSAWTPNTQIAISDEAIRLGPPDLYRQIVRHKQAFRDGLMAPYQDGYPARHYKHRNGIGELDRAIADESERAIQMIRSLQPFETIVYQLGIVAHFVADAHNPLNSAEDDPREGQYFADYLRYAETAQDRFPMVFYGMRSKFDSPEDLRKLAWEALELGRQVYPLIGREYKNIGYVSGINVFDDRSTAFGIASVAFSRSASDTAEVLRYIWLRAGGADQRARIPKRGADQLVVIPRTERDSKN